MVVSRTDFNPELLLGKWIARDGVPWFSQRLLDTQRERSWKRKHPGKAYPGAHLKPGYSISHPRLLKLRKKVNASDADPIPGRIRELEIVIPAGMPRPSGRGGPEKVPFYHSGDLAELAKVPPSEEIYEKASRQQNAHGDWCISPKLVAQGLGVSRSRVNRYADEGIPWMLDRRDRKLKPEIFTMKRFGHHGKEAGFWLEAKVAEYRAAKDALTENPGEEDDLLLQETCGMERHQIHYQRKNGKLEVVPRIGKNKDGFPHVLRLVPKEDAKDFLARRAHYSVPGTMTVREVGLLFKKVSRRTVRAWFRNVAKEETVRSVYKRNGRDVVQLREGWVIPTAKVERKWREKFPGTPWPLENGNQSSNGQGQQPSAKAKQETGAALSRLQQEGPTIVLGCQDDFVIVLGQSKPPLSKVKYKIVKELMAAKEVGLSGEEMADRAGCSDPHKRLRELAKDPHWAAIIDFPGKPWGRYRILSKWPEKIPQ